MVVLLVLAWAIVLGPALLRPRFEASPEAGVRDFERTLGILAGTRHGQAPQPPGRWVMVPKDLPQAPRRRRNRVIRRRRQMFVRLLIAAVGTLVIGLIPGLGSLLWVHLAIDATIVGYVLYLRRQVRLETQRREVVRPLYEEDEAASAAAAMARREDDAALGG